MGGGGLARARPRRTSFAGRFTYSMVLAALAPRASRHGFSPIEKWAKAVKAAGARFN